MCGISGKLYFDPARSVERDVLERMNAVLAHRGPDDAGIHCDGPIGLAHRRLSIIDLSPRATSRCRTRTARSGSFSTARSTTSNRSGPSCCAEAIGSAPTPTPR